MSPTARPRVVVLGAGFGGLAAVKALRKAPVEVELVDRHNYHLFAPLLYQVGTALLDPSEIAQPVRALVRKVPNAEFHLANVSHIDLDARSLQSDRGPIGYDYLIVAAGSRTNFFGNESLEQGSIGLKTMDDALALRSRLLELFETAKWSDAATRAKLLHFVVVGGGSTGIETAGAIAELVKHVLRKDFKEMDLSMVQVTLLEASDHLLAPYVPKLRDEARRVLERKGVNVMLETAVEKLGENEVLLSDGKVLEAGVVVWTAGVCGEDIGGSLTDELARGQRVPVRPTLQLVDRDEVFVIGDLMSLQGKDGNPLPMLAPVATQGGKHAARNLEAMIAGKPLEDFTYFDKGIMSTIGRNAAVVQVKRFRMSGFVGWVTWLFVHLVLITSFRSQLSILMNWITHYIKNDRPARLILKESKQAEPPPG